MRGELGIGNVDTQYFPVLIENLPKIKSVACGKSHSLALAYNGKLYGWGNNEQGQLALPKKRRTAFYQLNFPSPPF